eukprot:4047810-Prymnesium_polylepis.4
MTVARATRSIAHPMAKAFCRASRAKVVGGAVVSAFDACVDAPETGSSDIRSISFLLGRAGPNLGRS